MQSGAVVIAVRSASYREKEVIQAYVCSIKKFL